MCLIHIKLDRYYTNTCSILDLNRSAQSNTSHQINLASAAVSNNINNKLISQHLFDTALISTEIIITDSGQQNSNAKFLSKKSSNFKRSFG